MKFLIPTLICSALLSGCLIVSEKKNPTSSKPVANESSSSVQPLSSSATDPFYDCACNYEIQTVCGSNGAAYANSCMAECEGVTSYTPGFCGLPPEVNTLISGDDDVFTPILEAMEPQDVQTLITAINDADIEIPDLTGLTAEEAEALVSAEVMEQLLTSPEMMELFVKYSYLLPQQP
jgi:hypothetical protein